MAATLKVREGDQERRGDTYLAPFTEANGAFRNSLFRPDGYSLWEVVAELGKGAELHWGERHGDEVLFVLDGEIEVDGVRCGPSTAAIVESGVRTVARSLSDARLLHFGPASPEPPSEGPLGPPSADEHGVHVIAPSAAEVVGDPAGHGTRYYYETSCATCRAVFFENFDAEAFTAPSHVHSEDEIIHLLDGEMRVGRLKLVPGMSIAIPGGTRYGFRTPAGYAFLNYRRDASTSVGKPGSPPSLETVERAKWWGRESNKQPG
jgi:quercetin dioxygenase-like cupin family protein